MDFGRNTAAREPTGLRTLGLSQMRNRQRHTFNGWVRLSFIPCQRPWGHPRSVGGRQDRFVVARIRWATTGQLRTRVFVCRSVTGLDRPTVSGHFLLALPEPAVEQIQHVSEALARKLGVVARALVAAERMLAVHLQPREAGPGVFKRGVDVLTALTRDVRILATPDHQQLAARSPRPVQRSSFIPWPRPRLWISVA